MNRLISLISIVTILTSCAMSPEANKASRGISSVDSKYLVEKVFQDKSYSPLLEISYKSDNKKIMLHKTKIDDADYFFFVFCQSAGGEASIYCEPVENSLVFPLTRLNSLMGRVNDEASNINYKHPPALMVAFSTLMSVMSFGWLGSSLRYGIDSDGIIHSPPKGMSSEQINRGVKRSFIGSFLGGLLAPISYYVFKRKQRDIQVASVDLEKILNESNKSSGEGSAVTIDKYYDFLSQAIISVSQKIFIAQDMNGEQIFVLGN